MDRKSCAHRCRGSVPRSWWAGVVRCRRMRALVVFVGKACLAHEFLFQTQCFLAGSQRNPGQIGAVGVIDRRGQPFDVDIGDGLSEDAKPRNRWLPL